MIGPWQNGKGYSINQREVGPEMMTWYCIAASFGDIAPKHDVWWQWEVGTADI